MRQRFTKSANGQHFDKDWDSDAFSRRALLVSLGNYVVTWTIKGNYGAFVSREQYCSGAGYDTHQQGPEEAGMRRGVIGLSCKISYWKDPKSI